MLTIPSLKHARIAMILSLVSMTLLLLRNNYISLHQSSNFVQSLSNHSGSRTILLGTVTYIFLFISANATDISLFDHLFVSSEALFVIFNDPNLSDSASISFVLYELVLSSFIVYTTYVHLSSSGNFA